MKRQAFNSPKVMAFADELALPLYAARGVLESLWIVTGMYTPQGNIGKFTNARIASLIDWDGDADQLVDALINARLLDRDDEYRLLVHDWAEHCDQTTRRHLQRNGLEFAVSSEIAVSGQCPDSVQPQTGPPAPAPMPEPEPEPAPAAVPDSGQTPAAGGGGDPAVAVGAAGGHPLHAEYDTARRKAGWRPKAAASVYSAALAECPDPEIAYRAAIDTACHAARDGPRLRNPEGYARSIARRLSGEQAKDAKGSRMRTLRKQADDIGRTA